jgi:pseudouridine synthase, RluA family
MQILEITSREAGQRLDKFLLKFLNQAPSSFIYKMLRKKNIVLNSKKCDGSEKISENDQIKLFLSDETIAKFSKSLEVVKSIRLDIIYEDEDVIFINKPAGVLSQKADATDVSMNEYLISYLLESGSIGAEDLKTFRPAVCNRLDRNTSGMILAGKTMVGLQELSQMFKSRSLDKYYLCLVNGVVDKSALIKGYLHKNEKSNKVIISSDACEDDSYIETAYKPLCSNGDVTLLEVELITGRTHQIRSHLASIGHAIVGDGKYGNKRINEQFKAKYGLKYQLLHSWRICFNKDCKLEGLAGKVFKATLPKHFTKILKMGHLEEY